MFFAGKYTSLFLPLALACAASLFAGGCTLLPGRDYDPNYRQPLGPEATARPTPEAAAAGIFKPQTAFRPAEPVIPYTLFVKKDNYVPALYEPPEDCYLGAYILSDKAINYDIAVFEQTTGVKHALYQYHMLLDDPLPANWILECISKSAVPYIVLKPRDPAQPFDRAALAAAAERFQAFKIPMFIQFYPVTNKYSAEDYTAFFKEARALFKVYAPLAAFIWGVDSETVFGCKEYYPGDEYVDWAGIKIYEPLNSGAYPNVFTALDYFYFQFQMKKPIIISELAVSHFSGTDHAYHTEAAAREINDMYRRISEAYPRIKAIIYMDFNGFEVQSGKASRDDFSLTREPAVLDAYLNAAANGRFCGELAQPEVPAPDAGARTQLYKSPFTAWRIGGEFYISAQSCEADLGVKGLGRYSASVMIDSEAYYSLSAVMPSDGYELQIDTDNQCIVYGW
ncbi:MAG: hypothetical protein LBS62_08410 [Clostridiales bacterium]|jgi:hypothetical protein|nr:hypothetical protein [Clostridiales bacterium]